VKKCVYTLNINNYAPKITSITLPLMKQYAEKIGADFYVIKDRKFPEMPPVYEKFQIYSLADEHKSDWNLFFDLDALIHPDMYDVTVLLSKDVTCSGFTSDFSPVRFKPDKYFLRDGRFIGKGNWLMIASDWCKDIWTPLTDITFEEAVQNITPTNQELSTVVKREHLIDDYLVSRNIAQFGLKHVLISDLENARGIGSGYLWHHYLVNEDKKVVWMYKQLLQWIGQALAGGEVINANEANQLLEQWTGQAPFGEFLEAGGDAGKRIKESITKLGVEL